MFKRNINSEIVLYVQGLVNMRFVFKQKINLNF